MRVSDIEGVTLPEHFVNEIRNEVKLMRDSNECRRLYGLSLYAATLGGDLAEVGVFQGGSAKVMCEAKRERALHLFDTFEGLPEFGKEDWDIKDINSYTASLESVQDYLKDYPNVFYHKGRFPIKDEEGWYSMVHLDVDLYQSMKDCIEFFYPRMQVGGIILMNAYPTSSGIKKAIDTYFCGKAPLTQVGWRQCMVVKQ